MNYRVNAFVVCEDCASRDGYIATSGEKGFGLSRGNSDKLHRLLCSCAGKVSGSCLPDPHPQESSDFGH